MAETKYNLLTRLLKDLRNQVSTSGDIGGNSNGGVLVVHDIDGTLDKTWQEIFDAMLSGGAVIQTGETGACNVLRVFVSKGEYIVSSLALGDRSASSASGYPSIPEDISM